MISHARTFRSSYAIIGAGMLGMTIAHRLAQQGHSVTIFDAAPQVGGLASAWQLGEIRWDRHYHVILQSDTHLRSLFAELGIEREIAWNTTRTGFYTGGRLHSMSNSLEFLRFPPLNLIDKLRLAATIFHASRIKDWQQLEEIPVEQWLRRWSGNRTFEKIWLPLLRAKLGETYERTSAAFIWATIARMYAARRSGMKKELFGYVRGGYDRILSRFVEVLQREGIRVETSRPVKHVTSGLHGMLEVELRDGWREAFDHVVCTVPAPLAAGVCPEISRQERERLDRIQYLGIVCASVLLERPLSNYYITNITDSGFPFTAVIEMTALVDRNQVAGNALIYLPKYVTPDDPIFSHSDREIEERFLQGLERMHPRLKRSEILCFRISRARQVFALSTLGYSKNLPAMKTSVPGLFIVNSAHIVNGTLNVNETVQLAKRAVGVLNENVFYEARANFQRMAVASG